MASKPDIGFCGLGAMGMGVATNLVKQGYSVTGFDLYQPSLDKFKAAGGTPSTSLTDSATNKPFYIVMVASAQQAQPAIFGKDGKDGIAHVLPKGATLLLCSTVPSAFAKSVEKQLVDIGRDDVFFVDTPVSGGTFRAADGTLSLMVGASDAAIEKSKWLLEEMSAPSKLFLVKGGVGQGSNMKMVHQVLAAIQNLIVSEAYGFGARLGLNGQDVYDRVLGSKGASWMWENRSQRTLKEDYFPGASAVTIILKDTSIITSSSRGVNFPSHLCSLAEQVYFAAVDRGWGANDDSGVVRLWTAEPVTSIQSDLSAEDKEAKLQLVVDLVTAVHIVSAAEAICLAKHFDIPLSQFYELASDAAGGSSMFNELGSQMIPILEGKEDGSGKILGGYIEALKKVVDEAYAVKCPLYLGSAVLNLMLQAGDSQSLGSLLKCYIS